jgi:hypothetical protein
LFLYSDFLGEAFHIEAILEMMRVAGEVRIFPVQALDGAQSKHLSPVSNRLRDLNFTVTIDYVPYEFVRGSNRMVRVRRAPLST